MLVDMFGIPLAVGQFVLYADAIGTGGPELGLYQITELGEDGIILAEQLNGPLVGVNFYLENSIKRVVIIGNDRALYDLAECYISSTVN